MVKGFVRSVTKLGYQNVAKPLMFRKSADIVHKNLIKTAKVVQKTPGVRSMPGLWSHHNETMLSQTIAGVNYRNPVGLSAGFDKTIEMPKLMRSVGFGWMTGGSVTLGSYKGNEGAWYHRLPKSKSLVVNAGLPSEGTPVVSRRVALYSQQIFDNFPLNISVAKTNSKNSVGDEQGVDDYCQSLAVFDGLEQVSTMEINISCPNTFGGEPFTTPVRLEKLLKSVDELKLSKPVYVKMPTGLEDKDFDDLLKVIVRHNVTGVTISNLVKDRSSIELKDELPDSVRGGLSGLPAKAISNYLISLAYKKYGDRLIIIGVGGIMSADDAYEKIRAGASLVALITGLIYEGPQLIGDINHDLERLLKRDGYANVSEAVGVDIATA